MATRISRASPIAALGKACARVFDKLCALFEDEERQFIYDISHLQVCDSYGQFKIWAGNIGALQTFQSASSLDYRLREVPKVSKQVVSLLEDLDEALEGVIVIASGERENRVSSPVPFDAELLRTDGADWSQTVTDPSESTSGPTSEIHELFRSIPETIASLFKLSILIRNATSRDRFAKALAAASKAPFNDQFDIDHVGNKFPCFYSDDWEWLRKRLGKAITQRRHYLRYCREHREKLSEVPVGRNTTDSISEPLMNGPFTQEVQGHQYAQTVMSRPTSTMAPTTSSTVMPAKLESTESLKKLEEQNDDDSRSQTSYATSVGEDDSDNRLSVRRLEEVLDEVAGTAQSFECPYCWTIQRFNNQHAWRTHVMRDLKPYVCTSEECDTKLFPDRHTWFTHELQNHLVEWHCCFCPSSPYQTREKFDKHLRKTHADKFTDDQLPELVRVCQKPVDKLLPTSCPFCNEWEARLRELNKHMSADEILVVTPQQFRHHVGSHMEQLALFAIPRGYKEDGDAGSSRAAPGHGSDASSDRSLVKPDYEDEDNPRLHVAAFEGLKDEVQILVDEDWTSQAEPGRVDRSESILLEEGTTWGSALSAAAAGGHVDIADLCLPRRHRTSIVPADWLNILPRSKNKNWDPLHWAASNGHLAMIEFLMENGISVSDKAFDGSTAADLARRHGHDEIVQVLEGIEQKPSDSQAGLGSPSQEQSQYNLRFTVYMANSLFKRDRFSFPDPFAVTTVDGAQTKTTEVYKRSLNPYWNEEFDLRVTENSIITVKVFDHKKFKKKDQGFLGIFRFLVSDIIDLSEESETMVTRDLTNDSNNSVLWGKITLNLSTRRSQGTLSSNTLSAPLYTTTTSPTKSKFGFEDAQGPLPSGWEWGENPMGRRYYIGHNTKTTTWDRPKVDLSTAPVPNTATKPASTKPPSTPLSPGWGESVPTGAQDYFSKQNSLGTTKEELRRR